MRKGIKTTKAQRRTAGFCNLGAGTQKKSPRGADATCCDYFKTN